MDENVIISPGLIIVQKTVLLCLFSGVVGGGGGGREKWGLLLEGILRFKMGWD